MPYHHPTVRVFVCTSFLATACMSGEEDKIGTVHTELSTAPECTDAQRDAILAPGTGTTDVKCSIKLPADSQITRRLRFYGNSGNGVTFDCNGGSLGDPSDIGRRVLQVETQFIKDGDSLVKASTGRYIRNRPANIVVKNCKVYGTIRVQGLGHNGQAKYVKLSSHDTASPGHTTRARYAAPTNIVLDNLDILANGNAVYFAPGVTRSTLKNSKIRGGGAGGAVYLGAESYGNVLRNNNIAKDSNSREQVSLDGSGGNLIVNNYFSGLNLGGIYLYRNCGEGGTVRIATPMDNQIINNYFYYNNYIGSKRAVLLGSRDGGRLYCNEDSDYNYGSGSSNLDHARYNVVMQNQVRSKDPGDVIKRGANNANTPNYAGYNESVSSRISRKAGCYLPTRFHFSFVNHDGGAWTVVKDNGQESCRFQRCDDGVMVDEGSCSMEVKSFSCSKSGSNAGCSVSVSCPGNRKIIAAKAACNLETTEVSGPQLNGVRPGRIQVVQRSDNVSDGLCTVANTSVSVRRSVIRGSHATTITAACHEEDKNGGDCGVSGKLYCH